MVQALFRLLMDLAQFDRVMDERLLLHPHHMNEHRVLRILAHQVKMVPFLDHVVVQAETVDQSARFRIGLNDHPAQAHVAYLADQKRIPVIDREIILADGIKIHERFAFFQRLKPFARALVIGLPEHFDLGHDSVDERVDLNFFFMRLHIPLMFMLDKERDPHAGPCDQTRDKARDNSFPINIKGGIFHSYRLHENGRNVNKVN